MKTAKPRITVPSLIESLRQDVRNAQLRVSNALAHRPELTSELNTAKRIAGTQFLRCYINTYGVHPTLSATIRLSDVESLKQDRRLLGCLKRALDADLPSRETSDYVGAWSAERTFAFDLPHGGTLRIEANIKTDGKACRKVVTGEQMTTQTKYALVCD